MSCSDCSFPYSLCQCPEVLAARDFAAMDTYERGQVAYLGTAFTTYEDKGYDYCHALKALANKWRAAQEPEQCSCEKLGVLRAAADRCATCPKRPAPYKHLGNLSSAPYWSVEFTCEACNVGWSGCSAAADCPRCGAHFDCRDPSAPPDPPGSGGVKHPWDLWWIWRFGDRLVFGWKRVVSIQETRDAITIAGQP